MISLKTLNPPTPESNMPIGAMGDEAKVESAAAGINVKR
ncbi:MAG: hypothetical protein ANABAC_0913 [Anaerolineae bacterium]|nr:MAG: hypothetical protein ANABAC_0913 [Anaerolineae bacterium]